MWTLRHEKHVKAHLCCLYTSDTSLIMIQPSLPTCFYTSFTSAWLLSNTPTRGRRRVQRFRTTTNMVTAEEVMHILRKRRKGWSDQLAKTSPQKTPAIFLPCVLSSCHGLHCPPRVTSGTAAFPSYVFQTTSTDRRLRPSTCMQLTLSMNEPFNTSNVRGD